MDAVHARASRLLLGEEAATRNADVVKKSDITVTSRNQNSHEMVILTELRAESIEVLDLKGEGGQVIYVVVEFCLDTGRVDLRPGSLVGMNDVGGLTALLRLRDGMSTMVRVGRHGENLLK
jgi:hypothetical protein